MFFGCNLAICKIQGLPKVGKAIYAVGGSLYIWQLAGLLAGGIGLDSLASVAMKLVGHSGVLQYGMVWYGTVWYGTVHYGMV